MRGELAEVPRLWEIAAKPPLISRRAEPPTASPKGEATLTKNSHVCRNGTVTGLYPAGKE